MSAAEPIDQAISNRICNHMNQDHADAVLAFAKHYGGAKKPISARMVTITPKNMELEVDGALIEIPFAHRLTDSEDAHKTLVQMLRSIPSNCE